MLSKLLMGKSNGGSEGWVVVSGDDGGNYSLNDLYVYPWHPITGFGTPNKYAMGQYSGLYMWSALSPDGKTLLLETSSAVDNYVWVYPFDSTNGTIGTRYPDSSATKAIYGAAWHPDSNAFLLQMSSTSPYFGALKFEEGVGTVGSVLVPTGAPTTFPYSAIFSPNGNIAVFGTYVNGSTLQSIYAWSWTNASGFGSEITMSPTVGQYPQSGVRSMSFNKDGTKLAASGSVFLYVYDWSDTWGLSNVKKANYSGLTTPGEIFSIAWHPTDDFVICGTLYNSGGLSSVIAFPIASDGSIGQPIETPTTIQSDTRSVAISKDGKVVYAVSNDSTSSGYVPPYLRAWKWESGIGFGDEYTYPLDIDNELTSVNFTPRTA